MIRINLLPVRVSKKKVAGKQQLVFFALAAVFVLICNFWWSRSRVSELAASEEKLKRTRVEIAQLEKIIGEVKNIKAQQAAVKDKLAVLEKLKAGRQGPVKMLDELARLIPKRVWLRKLDEKEGAVTLEGNAGTIEDVSTFLAALKHAQYFSAPELKRTSAKPEGKFKMVEFTITATVSYTPPITVATSTVQGAPDGKGW
jgi:type IV pilus assembly protein PilN